MAAKGRGPRLGPWLWVGLLVGLAGTVGRGTGLDVGLLVVAAGIVGGWVSERLAPWLGPRRAYRLRYHAPTLDPATAGELGRGLRTLARTSERGVRVVARREAGQLMLAVDCAGGAEGALTRLLVHLLPEATLETLGGLPLPPGPLARWQAAQAGQGGLADPYDLAGLLDSPVLTGDGEVRLHLRADDGAVLVAGALGAAARGAGLRPLPGAWARLARRWETPALLGFAPWPAGPSTPLRLPATGTPGTARLDTATSLQIPLPVGYISAPEPALDLGWATVDGRAVRVPLPPAGAAGPAGWGGHFLALGADAARQATVAALLERALAAGVGVLYLDPGGERVGRLAPRLAAGGHPLHWIDLENPGGSLRLNLLGGPAAESLADGLPALADFLRALAVPEEAAAYALAWARVRLLAGGPVDLPALYAAWSDPDALPDAALAVGAVNADPVGAGALADVSAALAATTPASRRLLAAHLTTYLAPLVEHVGLLHLWRAAPTAPASVFAAPVAPLVLARLPLERVPPAEARAARWYGAYLRAAVGALARRRRRRGQHGRPLLVVLDTPEAWAGAGELRADLGRWGGAGIAGLLSSAGLPPDAAWRGVLLDAGTWWVHTLAPGDVSRLRAALADEGEVGDLPLAGLPAGVAVLRTLTASGPLAATVTLTPPPAARRSAGSSSPVPAGVGIGTPGAVGRLGNGPPPPLQEGEARLLP